MTADIKIVTRLGKGSPLEFEEMDTNLTSLQGNLEAALDSIQTTIPGNIQSLSTRLTQAQTDISLLQTKVTNIVKTIDPSLGSNVSLLTAELNQLSTDLVALQSSLTTLKARVDSISGSSLQLTSLISSVDSLTTQMSGVKSDISSLNTEISSLQADDVKVAGEFADINNRVDSALLDISTLQTSLLTVNQALSNKSEIGHKHTAADITGISLATPARFTYMSDSNTLLAGQVLDIVATIPAVRLYGVRVIISGLSANQSCKVNLYGESSLTTSQYTSNFTDLLNEDNSQAWMYRNTEGETKMYIRLTNSTITDFPGIIITIIAEPF